MARGEKRLTAKQVENAKDGWYNDGGNLHLRVNGGSKKWVLRYARHGKVTEIGLGGANRVTLKLARELRDDHLKALAKGLDPRAEKRKRSATGKTFGEAAQEVIEARRKSKWRVNVSDGRTSSFDDWVKATTVNCKSIAKRSVADIGVDDIKPIVKPVWDKGHATSARRLLNRIEIVFDYAKANGWRTADNPATWAIFEHILQADGPTGRKEHHPALDWRETPAFMAKLRSLPEPSMAALALEMMVLTAARSGEVRGMLWSEVDLDAAVWRIPAERMKRKLEHEVPLSADALALLKRLEAGRINKFVFPGRRSAGPVTNYPVWAAVQRLTGQEGQPSAASPHGMRASARSWMAAQGVPFDVAEACLAHATGNATVVAYNRETLFEKRRKVMSDWAKFLRGEEQTADIIPLAARRR
jgi:integrase